MFKVSIIENGENEWKYLEDLQENKNCIKKLCQVRMYLNAILWFH